MTTGDSLRTSNLSKPESFEEFDAEMGLPAEDRLPRLYWRRDRANRVLANGFFSVVWRIFLFAFATSVLLVVWWVIAGTYLPIFLQEAISIPGILGLVWFSALATLGLFEWHR